ncbi:g114 [Yersinia phage phiR1-37]|uniref:hypothetical protein n=1 Tax=Yersinia phage phiR1-37 TaxID=331278 RepID=UPI00022DBD1E|nr:hypothetical protein phiR1-37_gp114 [Yersinia phage phiR1-37]CCE26138.1 g114 [Yersinia phage phiR1-37]
MNILRWRGRQPIQEVQDTLSEINQREISQLVHDIVVDRLPMSSIAYEEKMVFNGRTSYPYIRLLWIRKC